MEQVRKALGRKVRKLRGELQLSQEQLAERAGLHWTHISGIERAQFNITLTTLTKVAAGLGLTLSKLFEGIDNLPRPAKKAKG